MRSKRYRTNSAEAELVELLWAIGGSTLLALLAGAFLVCLTN